MLTQPDYALLLLSLLPLTDTIAAHPGLPSVYAEAYEAQRQTIADLLSADNDVELVLELVILHQVTHEYVAAMTQACPPCMLGKSGPCECASIQAHRATAWDRLLAAVERTRELELETLAPVMQPS